MPHERPWLAVQHGHALRLVALGQRGTSSSSLMRRAGKTKIKMMRIGTSRDLVVTPATAHITDDSKRKPPLRAGVKCRQLPSNHTRDGSASPPPIGR
jgi:hypothetical protein